jgi:hypothetical protein
MNARSKKVRPRRGGNRITDPNAKGTKTAQGKTTTKLLVAMTGKASAAKAAEGDEPVFAYIASLPEAARLPSEVRRAGGQPSAPRSAPPHGGLKLWPDALQHNLARVPRPGGRESGGTFSRIRLVGPSRGSPHARSCDVIVARVRP